MLKDKKFVKEINQPYEIIKTFDIPYLAGYSKDDRKIYIDRHFPLKMGNTDIEKYIVIHEKTEKCLLDTFRIDYQQAHHIALHVEHMAIINDGINWKKYSEHCDKYIKTVSHEKIQKIPADLDLEPYKDEKDFKLLKDMIDVIRREESNKTRFTTNFKNRIKSISRR
jgi:hypothetical protein